MSISAARLTRSGRVEAHARGRTRATVVPGDKELAVAEFLHDFDLVLRHRAERVIDIVLARIVGSDAVAIAAQIRGDDMEALSQARRDLVP